MGKPLSAHIRSRLIAAVAAELSRRAAAERFGVSAVSGVGLVHAHDTTGSVRATPQVGDTRSHHVDGFSVTILLAIEAQQDISLVELAQLLRTRHSVFFAASTARRFLDRHEMTLK